VCVTSSPGRSVSCPHTELTLPPLITQRPTQHMHFISPADISLLRNASALAGGTVFALGLVLATAVVVLRFNVLGSVEDRPCTALIALGVAGALAGNHAVRRYLSLCCAL
jgi:hypothetical protein